MKQSSIPSASELRRAIQSAEVAADAFRQAGLNERADKLEEYIDHARKLRFSVGVVAQAKRGKSTLINGLLGRNDDMLAPIDRFPATNVVSCFANGTPEKARVLFQGDDEKAPGRTISVEDIKKYACEEHNPDNQKGVKVIEVVGPFPRLGEDVVLVDTPGADNALNRVHDIVLLEFLPKLDVVIFLVTADDPLVASELELLKQIRKNDVRKLLFAMNKVDKVASGAMTPDDLRDGLQHNRKILAEAGFEDASIFEISAKNFHATGEDPGTERLIKMLGDIIEEGRAGLIAERLAGITESHVKEAAAEIQSAIENSELTLEQIEHQRSQLEEIRRNLERNREEMERKFRSSWRASFDDFENALAPLQRQLVHEYQELVENSPAHKLSGLGNMIHTDVVKRLDELLHPNTDQLSESLATATRTLQVDVLGSMGIAPRDATALLTNKQGLKDSLGVALAGAPSLAGAAIVGAVPGLIGSAIMSAAPGVVAAVWYNPLTWIAAGATGAANAAVATAAAAVTGLLVPVALIGTPLLVGYAGLRVFSAWKHNVGRSKNELSIAVKDLIIASIDETRRNLRLARAKDDGILEEFRDSTATRISDAKRKLDELERNRPTPERLIELKLASKRIGNLKAPDRLPEPEAESQEGKRLFP
jgi:GTPase Era involved in 16S rRNA processing